MVTTNYNTVIKHNQQHKNSANRTDTTGICSSVQNLLLPSRGFSGNNLSASVLVIVSLSPSFIDHSM